MNNLPATKIVSTLGPVSNNEDTIRDLFRAGVTMFRINSSHESVEVHKKTLEKIRKVEKEENAIIPVLLDLQGPKIRIGVLKAPIPVESGEVVKFRHQPEYKDGIIPVDYKGIANDVTPNEKILIDDGKIQLVVQEVKDDIVCAKVLTTGEIKSRKGLNIPGGTGSIDILTKRDLEFVEFAMNNDIDFLGLSFVRNKDDVLRLREILEANGSHVRIISKIEKPQAIENIDDIIKASDGIMVARGDLGIEIDTELVPIAQKTIIRKANIARKPVIVATQMLESMTDNPIPTRAETSDVANAIVDGADAVMLSGETAMGKYPVEAVTVMRKISERLQSSQFIRKNEYVDKLATCTNGIPKAIALSVADTLKSLPDVKGVVTLTARGYTPALMSECRPSVPIYSLCSDFNVCRWLQLYSNVHSILVEANQNIGIDNNTVNVLNEFLKEHLGLQSSDIVIVTGSVPRLMSGSSTNFMKIHTVA